jgi:hypothetical protein
MTKIERIVLVGHCGADESMLRSAIERAVGPIPIERANDEGTLQTKADASSLMLVNRVLDGWFTSASGVALIQRLTQEHPGEAGPRLMLVSNYPEAQQQAMEAGALPGFGKSEQGSTQTAQLLREAVGLEESSSTD